MGSVAAIHEILHRKYFHRGSANPQSCTAIVADISISYSGAVPRPGEISLAHHGVLFLDELPEFDRRVLESLREPLETGTVTVSRARRRAEFPARFQLL